MTQAEMKLQMAAIYLLNFQKTCTTELQKQAAAT
jgi:hypothetical protein